jgi:ssDNA-binding Zn-finger/Zn-ribbon topoisomerase 1
MEPLFENNQPTALRCPECNVPLLIKTNRHNHTQFLGCPNYPRCRYTQPIPEAWIMRRRGQPELFELDGEA